MSDTRLRWGDKLRNHGDDWLLRGFDSPVVTYLHLAGVNRYTLTTGGHSYARVMGLVIQGGRSCQSPTGSTAMTSGPITRQVSGFDSLSAP